MFISWTACLLILFLEPPHRFFLGWRREVSPDKRPAWLALALFILFTIIWSFDPLGRYFGILLKPVPVLAQIIGAGSGLVLRPADDLARPALRALFGTRHAGRRVGSTEPIARVTPRSTARYVVATDPRGG